MNASPYTNQIIEGAVIGMHVIDSRIDTESERIPIRILFRLKDMTLLEHIFRADWIEVQGLGHIEILSLIENPKLVAGKRLTSVEITTRPDSQAKWQHIDLSVGTSVDLTVRGIHKRINYVTGLPFKDNHGGTMSHAKYCYIGRVNSEVSLPI